MEKLIALDLDDTLLGPDGAICPEHHEALRSARSRGCDVTFVTARSWRATEAFVREVGITLPVVCIAGALLYSPDGTLLRAQTIDLGDARRLAELAERHSLTIRLYFADGRIYTSRPAPDFVTKLGATYPTDVYVGDVTPYLQSGEGPIQIVFLGDRSVEAAMAEVAALPGIAPTVYDRGTAHSRCHLMQASVSKGAGLAALCRELGVERERVIAMGDNWPDRSMIEWAGAGVAMGWAPEGVRATADHVTAPDDPHPVASALRVLLG